MFIVYARYCYKMKQRKSKWVNTIVLQIAGATHTLAHIAGATHKLAHIAGATHTLAHIAGATHTLAHIFICIFKKNHLQCPNYI